MTVIEYYGERNREQWQPLHHRSWWAKRGWIDRGLREHWKFTPCEFQYLKFTFSYMLYGNGMVNHCFMDLNCFIFLSSDQTNWSFISKLNKNVCKCLSFQTFFLFIFFFFNWWWNGAKQLVFDLIFRYAPRNLGTMLT